MRSTCRLSLTMAGFALAALCLAQDPNAAPQPTPAPSTNSVASDPTAVPQQAPAEAAPALPVVPAAPEAGQAPAAPAPDMSVSPAPAATAPAVVNSNPAARTEQALPKQAAPTREATKARRKAEAKPAPSRANEKEKEKTAEAASAAATSGDTPANKPPADGTAASTAPAAPAAAPEALPPAPGLPDPMANVNTDAAPVEKNHTAWIPLAALVLGVAGAITLVARRKSGKNDISIVDRDRLNVDRDVPFIARDRNLPPPAPPMPRHS